jgi:hypothetical protein
MHCSFFLWYLSASQLFFFLFRRRTVEAHSNAADEQRRARNTPGMHATDSLVQLFHMPSMQTLGKGAFGGVQFVRHKQSRDLFALKSMSKCEMLKRYAHTLYPNYSPPHISSSVIFPGRTRARHSGLSSTSWRTQGRSGSYHCTTASWMICICICSWSCCQVCAHAMHNCACSSHAPHPRTPHNTQEGILGA